MSLPYAQSINLLKNCTATVTTATAVGATFAGLVSTGDRQLRSIQFTAEAITSGNGVFQVWVSNGMTKANGQLVWTQYNRLTDNVTNTNAQTDTRVASTTLSANQSKIYFFPQGDIFNYIMAVVAVTTDGNYSATLQHS